MEDRVVRRDGQKRHVRVVVVQEDEEGPVRTVLQPTQDFLVDPGAHFTAWQIPRSEQPAEPTLLEVIAAERGAADQLTGAHHEVGVVKEAASKTLLPPAVELVPHKARRRVSMCRERLGD